MLSERVLCPPREASLFPKDSRAFPVSGLEPYALDQGSFVLCGGPPWVAAGLQTGLCRQEEIQGDIEASSGKNSQYLRGCWVLLGRPLRFQKPAGCPPSGG